MQLDTKGVHILDFYPNSFLHCLLFDVDFRTKLVNIRCFLEYERQHDSLLCNMDAWETLQKVICLHSSVRNTCITNQHYHDNKVLFN